MTKLQTGGEVRIPSPYVTDTKYPGYADRAAPVTIAYRNWRSTMSGHPDCDGMIALSNAREFPGLRDFVIQARAGLSISWGDADRMPKQAWTGNEKRYQMVEGSGPNGREITQTLAVHRVGWFDVYDEMSVMYAVSHRVGLMAAVWMFDKHGGLRRAQRFADEMAATFKP